MIKKAQNELLYDNSSLGINNVGKKTYFPPHLCFNVVICNALNIKCSSNQTFHKYNKFPKNGKSFEL